MTLSQLLRQAISHQISTGRWQIHGSKEETALMAIKALNISGCSSQHNHDGNFYAFGKCELIKNWTRDTNSAIYRPVFDLIACDQHCELIYNSLGENNESSSN